MEIINFKKKKKRYQQTNSRNHNKNDKICYICKEILEDKHAKDKKVIVIIQGHIEVLHVAYVI